MIELLTVKGYERLEKILSTRHYCEETKFFLSVYQSMLDGLIRLDITLRDAATIDFLKKVIPKWLATNEKPVFENQIDDWCLIYNLIKSEAPKRMDNDIVLQFGCYSHQDTLMAFCRIVYSKYLDDKAKKLIKVKCKKMTKGM